MYGSCGSIHRPFDDGDDHGIGKANVLCRNDHQSAAGGLHLSRFQKAGKIMDSRIRVGAANGFLESGEKVIKVISCPICPHCAFLGHHLGIRKGQLQDAVLRLRGGEKHLHSI